MQGKKTIGISALLLVSIFTANTILPQTQPEIITKSQYLAYARAAADQTWENQADLIARWQKSFDPENVFGYRAPGGLLETAVIYAHLFQKEKLPEYANRAKKILLTYGDFRSIMPQWAVEKRPDYDDHPPMLSDFFTAMRFIRAYEILSKHNKFTAAEIQQIEADIADSMTYLLRSQEWGAMNRAALRAETLAWAVRVLPDHPDAKKWEMQRRALGDDNWGNWEIEDATIYHAVWLYALCGYADAMNRLAELFKTPEMYYYAHYFLNLMSPAGMIPDFGDANWNSNWNRFLAFFEASAAVYNDPHLKWAAARIGRRFLDLNNPTNIGQGYILLDCYLWARDDIKPLPPTGLSQEVMEDVQGKKIVFRNGWDKSSTYMLLNYRDEGDGGLNFRDYLRDSIPVEEEKMTHGHADENSIVLFMSGGSVLLHDGGYRDYMPSGPYGAYRQDYFHNRLCVRPEKIFWGQKKDEFRYSTREAIAGQDVLDFFRNAGSYREIRTRKVDFISLPDFDYSRTRLYDDKMGYEWDRVIVYSKDPELIVVFDVFKAKIEEYFSLVNLWHTRKILEQGEHWYDTSYDRIQNNILPQDKHLLIFFPHTHYRIEGTAPEQRHYQDEIAIFQSTAQHFELGETTGFITVLIPHSAQESPHKWQDQIRLLPIEESDAGQGVHITWGKKELIIGIKNDLRRDISRDWRRPRYTYEAGKIKYGDFETNGDFIFASRSDLNLDYTIVNLTRAWYKDQELIRVKSGFFGLSYDASPDKGGESKLRYWRDSIKLER